MNNLVIGSAGFIGKPFCQYLENQGETVVRYDLQDSKKNDARSAKLNLKKIDRVYFLAWEVGGSKYLFRENVQLLQLEWNLMLLTNVMYQLKKEKTPFLFVSSQLAEDVETVYGVTKKLGEVWTELLQGKCVRVWNAYGVMEQNNEKSHVLSDFVYQALKTKKIKMMTDGEEWRQFTHINDLSRAFHMAMKDKASNKIIFDASSYEWVQIKQVAQIIAELTGAKIVKGVQKGRNHRAYNMGRVPGWLPEITLRDGLTQMVEQCRNILKK